MAYGFNDDKSKASISFTPIPDYSTVLQTNAVGTQSGSSTAGYYYHEVTIEKDGFYAYVAQGYDDSYAKIPYITLKVQGNSSSYNSIWRGNIKGDYNSGASITGYTMSPYFYFKQGTRIRLEWGTPDLVRDFIYIYTMDAES
jgi:hypothetical protein